MAYDRGNAQGITKIAPLTYAVDSWREEGTTYVVRLDTNSCSCPFSARTGSPCKHIEQAKEARWQGLVAKAKALPQAELEALLPKYEQQGQIEIAIAIRGELFVRQQHAAQQDALRALFA